MRGVLYTKCLLESTVQRKINALFNFEICFFCIVILLKSVRERDQNMCRGVLLNIFNILEGYSFTTIVNGLARFQNNSL